MHPLRETPTVEETKHLVPNLAFIVEAVFGSDARMIDWQSSHADSGTLKIKYGDGLVWLPWKSELWLIEVEWKLGSNFLQQAQTFARSSIDTEKLRATLRKELEKYASVLRKYSSHLEDSAIKHIADATMTKYVEGNVLKPNMWVILGHQGDNIRKLRDEYERLLEVFFRDQQQYLLSMVRWFSNDVSNYFLLENYSSGKRFSDKVLLFPVRFPQPGAADRYTVERPKPDELVIPKDEPSSISDAILQGRTAAIWNCLRKINPALSQQNVRLRLQVDPDRFHDFEIDWYHAGKELMVITEGGNHDKPGKAARQVFGERVSGNAASKYGVFMDISQSPAAEIGKYARIDASIRSGKQYLPTDQKQTPSAAKYFSSLNVHKRRRINNNILGHRPLWETFLKRRTLTVADFKQLSTFKEKSIAGFFRYLIANGIATRIGDQFYLSQEAVPYIESILQGKWGFRPPLP